MFVAALTLTSQSGAQSTGRIVGTVQDTAGVRIQDAEVIVDGQRRLRTDIAGAFDTGELAAGKVPLRVRRLGYFPAERAVTARAGEVTRITIVLDRRPVRLDTIAVTADAKCAMRRFDGFACRRRSGKGVYFDVDAIDSINPRFPVDIFRGQPGFRVDAAPRGLILVSTSGWRCLTTLANGYPPSLQNPVPRWPNEMIGVEIYQDPDNVPGEYQRYVAPPKRCSLVIYWTQPRPRRR